MKRSLNGRKLDDNKMYDFFQEEAKAVFLEFSERKGSEYKPPVRQITQEGISKIYNSLRVMYNKEDSVQEICLIDNLSEILSSSVDIKGMEHLLINNYAAIENSIFLEYSSEGSPKRIREHYKHQFRNAYLGLVLLRDFHLDDCIESCILDKKNEYDRLILSAVSENREQLKEIIYKSFLVSALFHDIGYPLAYYFRTADEIHQFTPFFKIVNPAVKTVFAEIKALLNNSWLFRTVECEEIRKKYESNDHGCFSAISFLMNFYFSGVIYTLDGKEQCIVEMAAVAIYKHTNRYDENNRMVFCCDPLSYFLRMCDDLQEWQRFLVIIEDTHNYLQCSKCGKIIHQSEHDKRIYQCGCGKQFLKITQMENKKMNYIDICGGMEITNDGGEIHIYLEYDYFRMIELLLSDYEAVIYRDKGLKNVENMLKCQNGLPDIRLHYFLSNNPAEIIKQMWKRSQKKEADFVDWMNRQQNKDELREFLFICNEKLENKSFGREIEKNTVKYAGAAKKFAKKYLGEIYTLWKFLYT